ncbi:MAG TPA: hypothetical protein VGG35_05005 [Streptosporangiaceae bacterium]
MASQGALPWQGAPSAAPPAAPPPAASVPGAGLALPGQAAAPARARPAAWEAPDLRRWLQLALAALWVLDAVLQYQPVMFTRGFGQMLAGAGAGNPAVVAEPIRWAAGIVEHNPAWTNASFATIQLALGLGIAWRPVIRLALAGSVIWSVAVWWFGEGLGGVLTPAASPLGEAPGAVILYALLAVLLWPAADRAAGRGSSFVAAGPLGPGVARAAWVVLWGSLAYFAVLPASRGAQAMHDMIAGMAAGEPDWLASVNRGAASLLAGHGLAASIALAAVFAVIAAGIFLPGRWVCVALVLAIVGSAAIWLVAQDLGEILTGGSTDVNSAPLLIALALAYWPLRAPGAAAASLGAGEPGAGLAAAGPGRPARTAGTAGTTVTGGPS